MYKSPLGPNPLFPARAFDQAGRGAAGGCRGQAFFTRCWRRKSAPDQHSCVDVRQFTKTAALLDLISIVNIFECSECFARTSCRVVRTAIAPGNPSPRTINARISTDLIRTLQWVWRMAHIALDIATSTPRQLSLAAEMLALQFGFELGRQ